MLLWYFICEVCYVVVEKVVHTSVLDGGSYFLFFQPVVRIILFPGNLNKQFNDPGSCLGQNYTEGPISV